MNPETRFFLDNLKRKLLSCFFELLHYWLKTLEVRELKFYYYNQLRDVLESSRFEIKEEFGYYDKSKIDDGNELILVCGKKG